MNGPDLSARLRGVRDRIQRACERSGRDPAGVEILPVTKGHPPERVREVAALGLGRLAENRVGEAEAKQAELGRLEARWHMVGHLQRNKAGRAVACFDEVESVDSLRLARRLDREIARAGRGPLDVLVQVNASGEESKGGFRATDPEGEDLLRRIDEVCGLEHLRVRGLMTMAPLTRDEALLRATFRRTRRALEASLETIGGLAGRTLSMGMSNDFEMAVEEGSTRVRLGTVLVGERPGR